MSKLSIIYHNIEEREGHSRFLVAVDGKTVDKGVTKEWISSVIATHMNKEVTVFETTVTIANSIAQAINAINTGNTNFGTARGQVKRSYFNMILEMFKNGEWNNDMKVVHCEDKKLVAEYETIDKNAPVQYRVKINDLTDERYERLKKLSSTSVGLGQLAKTREIF